MANLKDEILKLANPTPVFKDPESFSDDETAAKLVQLDDDDHTPDVEEPSKLRNQATHILADTDKRYAGRRTSRKNLQDDSSGLEESEEEDDGSDEAMESDEAEESEDSAEEVGDEDIASFQSKVNHSSQQQFKFTDDGDYGKYGDDIDAEEDEGIDDSDGSEEDDEDDDSEVEEESDIEDDDVEGGGIQSFSSSGMDDVAKGQAAKQQLGLWDSLLEGRIKLQKAMSLVNQLPQGDNWQQFAKDSTKFAEESVKAQQTVKHLLDSLVHLQDLLLSQNKETSHMVQGTSKDANKSKQETDKKDSSEKADSDDEEIPSDSDEEMAQEKEITPKVSVKKRKLSVDEYPGLLKQRHDSFLSYRDTTIQKWYDRTRLTGGSTKGKSFSAFDQSALVQINQILADKERLIRRSQLKRSVYRVLGTTPKAEDPEIVPTEQPEDRIPNADDQKDYDAEIFDDDDFYHQLLRELIEKKASDTTDPVAISRQWLQIQKLRTKSKRKVDTKASKGRKIRYHVHKKLVNFMAPLDNCAWSHEARDDLFKSLFGKRFETTNSV